MSKIAAAEKGKPKRGILSASRSTDADTGSYLDFEVEINQGQGREYPLKVLNSPAGEASETLSFPFDEVALESRLKSLEIALLRSGGQRRQVLSREEQAVQDFGRQLFASLFAGEARTRYDMSADIARRRGLGLRLKLRIEAPELARLPWEFLYDPRQGEYVCMSRETPIVRYIELAQPIQPLAVQPPLQILGMVSSPSNLPSLDVEREKNRLETAIRALQSDGLVKLTWLEGSTWRDLQRGMRGGPWHIFHFIGHGGFDTNADEGVIALEDEDRSAHLLLATELGRLLADHRSLRLAVLNACEGARGSEHDIFSSTAAVLVRRGLPAVLAMQYAITDRAAIEFSRAFYEALSDSLPVDASVCEARKAISLAITNTIEWGTPVLYMRTPQGSIFEMPAGQRSKHTVEPFVAAQADKELQARLDQWFTEGLAAFWVEDWDRACARFQSILEARPDYPEAAARLEQSTRQRQLAALYARARQLQDSKDWLPAISTLEELLKTCPDYQDAAALLKEAQQQSRLAGLYEEARRLFKADQWHAVVKVIEQISSIHPSYPDADGLLPAAQKAAQALQRKAELDARYAQALRMLDGGRWEEARNLFGQIQAEDPGYRETTKLLARADGEISRSRQQHEQQALVNSLYEQAHGLMRARQWGKAQAKLAEIRRVDAQFADPDGIAEKAAAELQRDEQETQRQTGLSTLYAEAVRLLRDARYQEALEKWGEVHAWDSKFPDRQNVQATARKRLAEHAKVAPIKRPLPKRTLAIAGGAVLLVAVAVAAVLKFGIPGAPAKGTVLPEAPVVRSVITSIAPNPSPAPQPLPAGDPTLYDDFNGPGTVLDLDRWQPGGNDPAAQITKQAGALRVTTHGFDRYVWVAASRFNGFVPKAPFFMEAQFKLDPNENGSTDVDFNYYDKGTAMCSIWEDGGTQQIHCFVNFFDKYTDLGAQQISAGTWHTARIEVEPSAMRFSFYIDGLKVGDYLPDRVADLKGAPFTAGIGTGCDASWCKDKSERTVDSYFDNFRIGGIDADPTVYDSFDNPAYNGSFDTSKWQICGSNPGSTAIQEDGVLSMTHAGTTAKIRSTDLCALKFGESKISEPTYFEASLMFPSQQTGQVSMWVAASDSSFTGCFHNYFYTNNASRKNSYQTVLNCYYGSQTANWASTAKNVSPGTWHTVRIELQPGPGDFIYYLDGQQYGSYHAGSDFSQLRFSLFLQVTAKSTGDVVGYIDDVKIGPIVP